MLCKSKTMLPVVCWIDLHASFVMFLLTDENVILVDVKLPPVDMVPYIAIFLTIVFSACLGQ